MTMVLNSVVLLHNLSKEPFSDESPTASFHFHWFLLDYGAEVVLASTIFFLILGVFFFFPLILLVAVQTKNMAMNQTTSERFGRRRMKKSRSSSSLGQGPNGSRHNSHERLLTHQQPQSNCLSVREMAGNCLEMCCERKNEN
eukprot:CAMPEP_0202960372 /NCGR_PEP_ID=MMETSP1396-20130829/4520_1 /ASSEMBLY_ACC=CAM_ASM_000872 /TAXON_ID= /ORGANISM="Pseudokeronopsis sp., Strain Brazil" /LENGTH=141 /DNA_ID=CAMNT_0049679549 /DNA_START=58 /DNA_END=483 /DNA_ORIENTATION=-